MFYIHKDDYPNDFWWKGFSHVLDSNGLDYKLINLHTWEKFDQVDQTDYLLARLGHVKDDKEAIKPKLPRIYSSWNEENIFPPKIAYSLYDDKWKEYKFLKNYNLPTLETSLVGNKKELSKFLSTNSIDFPIVLKKPEGAGSENVWRFFSLTEISDDIFPVLVQGYIETNFDIRLFYVGDKFFAKKRLHSEEGSFPYGGMGVTESERIRDIVSLIGMSFLRELRKVFYINNDIPSMSFDLIESEEGFKIIEFSYCFNYKIPLDCSHYYDFSNSEFFYYYDDGDYKKFNEIKYTVPREIIKWVTNDNLDLE